MDTTGFINEESKNSHLLDHSSDGEIKRNNLVFWSHQNA